jgi:hypothetical protein
MIVCLVLVEAGMMRYDYREIMSPFSFLLSRTSKFSVFGYGAPKIAQSTETVSPDEVLVSLKGLHRVLDPET